MLHLETAGSPDYGKRNPRKTRRCSLLYSCRKAHTILNSNVSFYRVRNWKQLWESPSLCLRIFFFFFFLGPHLQHMEVPRLGVESELLELAYATATAMPDLSRICDLHYSLRQRWIFNPLSEVRDWICFLMNTSWVRYCWARKGTLICSRILCRSSCCGSAV